VFGGKKKSRITYCPEKGNSTPPFLYSMDKAKRDFGFVPQFDTFRKMMEDYKAEQDSGRWNLLIDSRKKD